MIINDTDIYQMYTHKLARACLPANTVLPKSLSFDYGRSDVSIGC